MIVWLLQTGESLHCDQDNPRPMRSMNLANKLVNAGHNVVLWSSAFHHQTKTHRSRVFKKIKISENLEIRLIPSSGYKRNISVSRLYDHGVLAWNLSKNLNECERGPDVAFIGYPPIEAAYVMGKWLKKRNIPFLLDVKDQWPNVLVESFPGSVKFLARILFAPYYVIAKQSMQNASGICAHTAGFVDWASTFSSRDPGGYDFIAPLTAPKGDIDPVSMANAQSWWSDQGVVKAPLLRVIFVGSFSRAFDFDAIFEAATLLRDNHIACEFLLCGDGDRDQELRSIVESHDNIRLFGWIDSPKIRVLAQMSDLTIAPYISSDDFMISVPNKIIDSLMLGMPLLSPLKGEVASLIGKHNVGFTYGEDTDLYGCISSFIADDELLLRMSGNAKKLYELEFEFDRVYDGLIDHLIGLENNE